MSRKYSEQFHDTLIAQYKDMIHEAILECDHRIFVEEDLYRQKCQGILAAAKIDGVDPTTSIS